MKNNFKKLFAILIFIAIFIPINAFANNIKIWLNGNYIESDVPPFIENGRTLVPVRVISENLGYEVNWDKDLQQVLISKASIENPEVFHFLTMTIGDANIVTFDKKAKENNEFETLTPLLKTPIDAAPKVVKDRTFVPIRVIAESFGLKVDWDETNRAVVIGEGYNLSESKESNQIINADLNNSNNNIVSTKEPIKNNLVTNPKGTNNLNTYDIPVAGNYVGNANSKKFHKSSCPSASKTSPKNRVNLNSREEAINKGFTPCKICNP